MSAGWLFSDVSIFVAGVLGAMLALPVLIWAVLWDWSRGRARCHACWHSLEGVPVTQAGSCVCPECGKLIKSERARYRRRIRVRWAAVSLLVLSPSVVACAWPLLTTRWIQMLPTGVLIGFMPQMTDPGRFRPLQNPTRGMLLHDEMWNRLNANELSRRQKDRMRARAIGILERRSADESIPLWESHEDPLWRFVGLEPVVSPDGLAEDLERLVQTRVNRSIHLRERWPRGTRPRAHCELDCILPGWVRHDVTLLADTSEALFIEDGDIDRSGSWRDPWWDWSTPIGLPTEHATSVEFDVLLSTYFRDMGQPVRESVVWSGRVSKPFAWVSSIEDCIEPLAGDEQADLESALHEAITVAMGERPSPNASLALDVTSFADEDVAIALQLSWELADRMIWRSSAWHCPLEGPSQLDGEHWILSQGNVYRLAEDSPQWILRVRGHAEGALRHPVATRYWDGELVFELTSDVELLRVPGVN